MHVRAYNVRKCTYNVGALDHKMHLFCLFFLLTTPVHIDLIVGVMLHTQLREKLRSAHIKLRFKVVYADYPNSQHLQTATTAYKSDTKSVNPATHLYT